MSRPVTLSIILITTVIGLLMVSCDHDPIQSRTARGEITGQVIDAGTEQAVADVRITCGGRTTLSDDRGRYYLTNIEKGVHDFFAEKEGYQAYAIGLYISSSTNHNFSLSLTVHYGSLSGHVLLGDSDVPVEGATVTCALQTEITGPDGYFSMDSILRETYALKVVKHHYLQYTAWVTIDTDVVHDARMAASTVSGIVSNFIDGPVPGMTVRIGASLTTTDNDGFYRLDPAPQGTHTIIFSHPEYFSRSYEVTIPSTELRHDATVERLITDTLFATHDATISMAEFADCGDCPAWGGNTSNYGNESRLRLEFFLRAKEELPPEAYIGRSRFLIKLPSLPEYVGISDLEYARFEMVPTGEAFEPGYMTVKRLLPGIDWSEDQVTWQTLPEVSSLSYATGPAVGDDTYELDVLPIYTDRLDSYWGLLFQKEETGLAEKVEHISFWSSEAPDSLNRPCVIIQFVH